MTSTLTANRVSHADLAFDADHATVVGTDDRDFMVGSFMELADMENHDCHASPMDGCDICEKYAHEAWTAQA